MSALAAVVAECDVNGASNGKDTPKIHSHCSHCSHCSQWPSCTHAGLMYTPPLNPMNPKIRRVVPTRQTIKKGEEARNPHNGIQVKNRTSYTPIQHADVRTRAHSNDSTPIQHADVHTRVHSNVSTPIQHADVRTRAHSNDSTPIQHADVRTRAHSNDSTPIQRRFNADAILAQVDGSK